MSFVVSNISSIVVILKPDAPPRFLAYVPIGSLAIPHALPLKDAYSLCSRPGLKETKESLIVVKSIVSGTVLRA